MRSSALGWGISLLAHALAVAWLWHDLLPRRADTDTEPVKAIEVRLVPIAPAVPTPLPAPAPEPASPRSRSAPARQPAASAVPAVPAVPIVAAPEPASEAPAGSAPDGPTVDLAAARAAARRIAREDARGLVALPARKPVVDPNADHHVVDPLERARRPDCQTARAGSTNLLANVVMLAVDLTKNAIDDSGCKW